MKPNPCILCGRAPRTGSWGDERDREFRAFSCYCFSGNYPEMPHSLQTYGSTQEQATAMWNRVNPAEGKKNG